MEIQVSSEINTIWQLKPLKLSNVRLCVCVQYLETMADIVKQGIVKAVEDLEKENQEKLMQEVCISNSY